MPVLANDVKVHTVVSPAAGTAPRLDFLDAVRGIAALLVILHHCFDHFVRGYSEWASHHLSLGPVGVFAFFVVSGFVIPMSLQRSGSLTGFWGNRVFRLFPLYWFCLICVGLTFVTHAAVLEVPDSHFIHSFAANLTMLPQVFGSPNLLSVFWTLNLELVFYFLCTAIWLAGFLRQSYLLLWMAALGYVSVNLAGILVVHRPISGDDMALIVTAFAGAAVYQYFQGELPLRKLLIGMVPMALSLMLCLWLRHVRYPKAYEQNLGTIRSEMVSIVCGWALFVGFYLLRKRRIPKVVIWLGKISYSTYLTHAVLLMFFPRTMNFWLGTGLLTTSTLLFSSLTFRYIETPCIKFHKRLSAPPKLST